MTTCPASWDSREFNEAPPAVRAQVGRAMLNIVFGELEGLFSALNGLHLPFSLGDSSEPHIAIARGGGAMTACLTIDIDAGFYVLREFGPETSLVLTTRIEERLVDQIVAHLGGSNSNPAPRTIEESVGMLIGQTIADVERNLILQTLRRCNGNPTRAAFMLGIPVAMLRSKLAVYFGARPADGPVNAGRAPH